MTPDRRPGYLKPVPAPGSAAAAAEAVEVEQSGTPGLTTPLHQSHGATFVTDVLVELGYVSRESVDLAINEARGAGRSPEALLVEQRTLDGDQLARAMAERYGLDHVDLAVFKVDMGAANLLS